MAITLQIVSKTTKITEMPINGPILHTQNQLRWPGLPIKYSRKRAVIANPRKYIHNSRADSHSPSHISTSQPGKVWMLVLYNILWERWMTSNCNNSFDFWGWTDCNNESTPKVHKSSLHCITTSFFCFEGESRHFQLVEWLLKSPTEICQGFHMLVSLDVDQMLFFLVLKLLNLISICTSLHPWYFLCNLENQKTQPSDPQKFTNLYLVSLGPKFHLVNQHLTLTWLTYPTLGPRFS